MKVKYVEDIDAALLEFSASAVNETIEVDENIYIDLNAEGALVSITIEHAKQLSSLPDVTVEHIKQDAA